MLVIAAVRVMDLHYFGEGWAGLRLRDSFWCVLDHPAKEIGCGIYSFKEAAVAVQNAALSLGMGNTSVGAWRSRTLAILLMAGIGAIFWVDSRYPALMKRYHAGTGGTAKVAVLKLATVLFLIFVFAPAAASREEEKMYVCPIDIPVAESWWQALVSVARSYAKSFWYVFRAAFPLMILGAVLGALVIEMLPPQAIVGQASILGIVLVALAVAVLPVAMAFDAAIAYIAMTHGAPMPYVVAILCTLGIISVFSLSVIGKTISWRLAAATYATVAALGIVAGVIARSW